MAAKAAAQKFTWLPVSSPEAAPCDLCYQMGLSG